MVKKYKNINFVTVLCFYQGLLVGPLNEKVPARCIIMTAGLLASTGLVLVSWVTENIAEFGVVLISLTGKKGILLFCY